MTKEKAIEEIKSNMKNNAGYRFYLAVVSQIIPMIKQGISDYEIEGELMRASASLAEEMGQSIIYITEEDAKKMIKLAKGLIENEA